MEKRTIKIDTREQLPWSWRPSDWLAGSETGKLDQGDYCLVGDELGVVAERKRSVAEIANNLTDKRFGRELDRLKACRYPVVICEFTDADLAAYPAGSDVPRTRWASLRVKGPFLLRLLAEHQLAHPWVHWAFFAGRERAYEYARCLFKRAAEAAEAAPRE
mgnify:CR=1 FL=1